MYPTQFAVITQVVAVPKVEFNDDQKNANIEIPIFPLRPRYEKVKGKPVLVVNACLC